MMNRPSEFIPLFIKRARAAAWMSALARGLSVAVPILFGLFLVFSGAEGFFDLPSWSRQLLWGIAVAAAALALVRAFIPLDQFSVQSLSKVLHQRAGERGIAGIRCDEVRIGADLLGSSTVPGISEDLRDVALTALMLRLQRCSPWWGASRWPWQRAALVGLAIVMGSGALWAMFPLRFPMGPRILFPFASDEISRSITITPGDADVPWGSDADVRVVSLVTALNKPVLSVKSTHGWITVDPQEESDRVDVYRFKGIVEPLVYRVRWRNEWSRRFTLTPVKGIQIEQFRVTITPPDYLSRPATTQTDPEISGLVGTGALIEADVSAPVKEAFVTISGGEERRVDRLDSGTIRVSLTIVQDGFYSFSFVDREGRRVKTGEQYPIHVLKDEAPSITLLSPLEDLIVGATEKLPITYEVADDFGLRAINLHWEKHPQGSGVMRIRSVEGPEENLLATYNWDLNRSFAARDVVRFRLEAVDANTVTGPGRAFTPWRIVELASFEEAHAALEEALKEWRDQALDLLADVNVAKSRVEDAANKPQDMMAGFNQTQKRTRDLEETLKRIVGQMEKDPLADYSLWMEHKAMQNTVAALQREEMKNVEAALHTGNRQAASSQLEQIASELERMTALSETLSKAQQARDILEAGDNLASLSEDLMNEMKAAQADGGKVDPALMKQVKETLEKAQKLLSDIARSIQQFPHELPEDFVNQEAMKQLELGKSQDLMSQISEAMKSGDLSKAMSLAQQLLQAAQNMQKQLSKAHEGFVESNSTDKLAQQISAEQKKLEAITDQQLKILTETQRLDAKRMAAVMKEQEKLLEALAKRQAAVVDRNRRLATSGWQPKHLFMMQVQLPPMARVAEELQSKRVQNSPAWLAEIVTGLNAVGNELAASSATTAQRQDVSWMVSEEKEILEAIQKPVDPPSPYSGEDQKSFESLERDQSALSKQLQSLKRDIQALSRKTASLGLPVSQSLSRAVQGMDEASLHLREKTSESALRAEEKALQNLMEGQAAMQQAQSGMAGASSMQGGGGSPGGPGGGIRVIQRGGQGGSSGAQTGQVRLPTVDDYRPPKEFREELLKSLKERYPEAYEDIIHKYFRRLSE